MTALRNQAALDDWRKNDAVCMVLVTVPSPEKALEIAHTLVEESLIACANVIPGVRSIYRWNGELCDDNEALILMKTCNASFQAVKARILAMHTYEVPEILQVEIRGGHQPYLNWVLQNCIEVAS